jgi:hypothetical protein
MASGDVVNTASRIQSAAPIDGILVDETTHRATARAIEFRDHEPVLAKGKAEPVPVHEALGARSRVGVDVRQAGRVDLVGRQARVGDPRRRTAAGDRRSPASVGDRCRRARIGKSRLIWELYRHVDASDQLIAWRQAGRCPTPRASRTGPSARWSRRKPGSWRTTRRVRPRPSWRRRWRRLRNLGPTPNGWSATSRRWSGSRRDLKGVRSPWRGLCRLAALPGGSRRQTAAGARVRGPPLGRRRPARLH